MGKINSKQGCKRTAPEGECFLVNAKVTSVKDLVAAINSSSSFTEAFVELEGNKSRGSGKIGGLDNSKIEITNFTKGSGKPCSDGLLDPCVLNIPLKVILPPLETESNLLKLLTVDRSKKEGGSDGVQTDTTDNNHGSEKSDILKGEEANTGAATAEDANSGPELQEWLFTLYDFDELGKITKEDIAGLLKSLYDTVGSVITLQSHGGRVLKLHLTVTPGEKPKHPAAAAAASADAKVSRAEAQEEQCLQDATVSDCAKAIHGSVPKGQHCCTSSKKLPRSRCQHPSHVHHGSPRTPIRKTLNNNQPTAGCGKDRRTADPDGKDVRNFRGLPIRRRQSFSGGFEDVVPAAAAAAVAVEVAPPPAADSVHRSQQSRQQSSGASKRLSQFDDWHLADLIQHNMDLNDQHQQLSCKVRRHRNRQNQDSCSNQNRSCPAPEESAQRRNYYLDLAGIENYETSKDGHLLTYAQPCFGIFGEDEEFKRPQRKLKTKSSPSTAKHSRCISGQTDFRCTNTICEEDELTAANVVETTLRDSLTRMDVHTSLFKTSAPPAANDIETISSSHYRRRHRHRERNQSRAMKQVAEWIEKEHVFHKTEKHVVVVQRHEHHHVHEHFHHHIHHCDNT